MEASYHRHDISDKEWEIIAPYLPMQRGQWGGIAKDNRNSSKVYQMAKKWYMGKSFGITY